MTVFSKVRTNQKTLQIVRSCLQKQNVNPPACNFKDVRCLQTITFTGNLHFRNILSDLKQHKAFLTQGRNFFSKSGENVDEESGMPLRHPEKGILVYTGRMSKVVRNLKILSLSTSLVSAGCQPFIIAAAKDDFIVTAGILSSMCLLVFSTPIILHIVTKKYVTDIYFNEDTKTFTLARKSFFIRRKEVQYKADDAKVSLDGGLFVTHKVKGVPYFIEYTDFRSKELYLHMVGYDKPVDCGIPDPNAHMRSKKFGLFEDEEDLRKPSTSVPLRSNMAMIDDDDDEIVHKTPIKKKVK